MAGSRRLARVIVGLVAILASAGCDTQDLNFRADTRLQFLSPQERSTVHTPLTITWRMDDFRTAAEHSEPPSPDAGYFAIFVDQTPIEPAHAMDDVAEDDEFCKRSPTCPDADYLAEHDIYTTTNTSIEIPFIANISGNKEELQLHTITIVLMDTSGHRIGESAWEFDIRMRKVGEFDE